VEEVEMKRNFASSASHLPKSERRFCKPSGVRPLAGVFKSCSALVW
jgi:hypothetical protein